MKLHKLSSFTTAILMMSAIFMMPISVYAASPSYTFNANWIETTCTGTLNGSTGILNYHITQGDTLNITLVNQSAVDLNVTYAKSGGTGSFYKFVKSGASDSESFANVQGNISVNPSANGSGCGTPGYQYSGPGPASASITADPPATTSPTSTATPKTTPSTTTSPAATPSATPAAPDTSANPVQLTTVYVGGKSVATDKTIEFNQSQELKLSGHTTANGLLTLTIHSTPKTVTAAANANGDWDYTVTGLAAGDHYIEASVTDPLTKQVSATTKLISFKVNAQHTTAAVVKTTPHNNGKLVIGGVLVSWVLATVLAFVLIKKKARSQLPQTSVETPVNATDITSDTTQTTAPKD